jgi:serine/threonine protein kinase/WD40 repeat protein
MSAHPPVCMECGSPLAASSPALLCGACLWSGGGDAGGGLLKVPGHDVLEEIARGGMGVVYRARERETQRIVALKMLRPRLADEEGMRERFRLEAAAMAALHHPSILPVYRVDESDDMPFFTMKLAAGGTLSERRAHYRSQWREIAGLMVTLAEAVEHAHRHGVLHRDLKPGNVLFDEEARACLTDFGLVKLIDGVSELTGSQSFLGTPHYSSPEVASSSTGAATVVSDVWSLGAMLYELLTGRLPFDAPGLVPLLRKIAEEPPSPFTAADAVPPDLRVITLKCLHKEPSHRYQSAAALGADLKAWLAGHPISARAASPPERLLAWTKRNPVLAAMAAALFVSLALLGVLLWRGYAASQRSASEARAGESTARTAEAASILEETRAQLRDGQWVNRTDAISDVLHSHALNPSGATRDLLVSLLALPELQDAGFIPYSRQNPNPAGGAPAYLSGDFSRYLARAGNSTEVRSTATHDLLFTVPGSTVASREPGPLSADGRLLVLPVSSGVDILNVETGTRLGTLPAGRWQTGFSRDGTLAASGRGILRTGAEPPSVLQLTDPEFDALAISPDGKMLLTAHRTRLLMRLVDTATGTRLREYSLAGKSMMLRAVWSAGSTHFCTGSTDGRMMRWNVRTSAPEWIVPAHTDGIDDLALFDDDRHLVSVSRDGLTKIWNLHTQSGVATFPLSGRRAQASADGRRLALDSAADRKTLLFQFTPPPVCMIVRLPASYVPDSSLQGKGTVIPAADGKSFAVSAGADLHILDRDGLVLRSLPCGQCADLASHPAGSGFIRTRRLPAGNWQLMRVPLEPDGALGDPSLSLGEWKQQPVLAVSPATGFITTGIRGTIERVNMDTGARTVITVPGLRPRGRVTALAYSPCGRYFAWAGVENEADPARRVHLMDAAAEKEIALLPLREAPRLLAFSPSGDTLIAGNNHGFHCLETSTGRELWSVPHTRPQEPTLKTPVCLAIAEKSGTLAIPRTPDSISLIDPATGRIRLTLRHPMGHTLRAIGLSPDGTRLIAVGSYIAQVWKLDAAAEELARYGMTY